MSESPKDPSKYGYRASSKITISGSEFIALQRLAQKAVANGFREEFVQDYEWVNVSTSKIVAKPTKKQIEEGKVQRVPSRDKTLSNKQVVYDSNLFPEVFNGNDVVFQIHVRNIENEVAVPVETLQKEYEDSQKAQEKVGQMEVVQEEEVK